MPSKRAIVINPDPLGADDTDDRPPPAKRIKGPLCCCSDADRQLRPVRRDRGGRVIWAAQHVSPCPYSEGPA